MMIIKQFRNRTRSALLALAALAWLAHSPAQAAAAAPIDGDLAARPASTAPAAAAVPAPVATVPVATVPVATAAAQSLVPAARPPAARPPVVGAPVASAPTAASGAPATAASATAATTSSVDAANPQHLPYDLDVSGGATPAASAAAAAAAADGSTTYHKDDLIGAAQGVFGKGASGLAGIIEDLLRKQGEPNGYIVGREGSGALIFGLRYGSGTLHHKIEGERPVYWTGPSIGFDAGANAASAFVLVYNLFDTEDLFKRFGAGEGQAYLVGGFHVSYLRRGNIVLVPVRAGAGLRLGINAGYLKFTPKQNWLPF